LASIVFGIVLRRAFFGITFRFRWRAMFLFSFAAALLVL